MNSKQISGIAAISFGSAREAERRIAGVAAAARIVREIAEAGLAEAWLLFPDGQKPNKAALDDVRRLGGPLKIEVRAGNPPPDEPVLLLPGNRLVAADQISNFLSSPAKAADLKGLRLDRRGASAELLRRTGKAGDGPVSRCLNRPLSRRLSALLALIPGFRPIHATAGTGLLALLMFAALVGGGATGLIVGALLGQAASIFDGVDGELARVTFRTSRAGAILDSVVDVATNILFIAGLTINLALRGEQHAVPLAAWGFALFLVGLATIAWRASRTRGPFSLNLVKHHYRHRFPGPPIRWLISFFTVVSSRDFFALLFAVLVVVGWPIAVLYLFATAATVWILFVAGSIRLRPDGARASPSGRAVSEAR